MYCQTQRRRYKSAKIKKKSQEDVWRVAAAGGGRVRTDACIGHHLAVVREAFETAEEERASALERVDGLKLPFLVC
jgi:hypothetical protein